MKPLRIIPHTTCFSVRASSACLSRSFNLHPRLLRHSHGCARATTHSDPRVTWSDKWSDILAGGNQRWKVTDEECHKKALSHFQRFVQKDPSDTHVFCPLAGDDPFVYLLFSQGYSVTAIDLVPEAIEELKRRFKCSSEEDWVKEDGPCGDTIVWKHVSGRATCLVGDALQKRPELEGKFDAVYDKDSFGALLKDLRHGFCARIAEFTKKGGIIYLECKLNVNHEEVVELGPPFSLKGAILMEDMYYGAHFEYLEELGVVYGLSGFANMRQTGHIMKRK